jgi:hypothetical protein
LTIWLNGLPSCQGGALLRLWIFSPFVVVCVLLSGIGLESETMTAEKTPILRGKSMELLKDLTQILEEIIRFGDEDNFRRLEETIRAIDESRGKPGRTIH